jgi:hypothetical protein
MMSPRSAGLGKAQLLDHVGSASLLVAPGMSVGGSTLRRNQIISRMEPQT